MYHLIQHAKQRGKNNSTWFGLKNNVETKQLDALGYAKAWATVYVLAKHKPDQFKPFLQDVNRLGPLEDPPESGSLFRKHFGEEFRENEEYIVGKLRNVNYVDPFENLTYYVGIADTRFFRKKIMSPSPREILEWRNGLSGVRKFAVKTFSNRTSAESFYRAL